MRLFRRTPREDMSEERWAALGLGNPGERYAGTRHNAGVMVVEKLLERSGARLKSHKSGCLIADVRMGGSQVVLGRTTSYMNESGRPVRALLSWYKIPPERLILVHDEIDLPFGDVRIKSGGGVAGHNGLRSVVNHLGTRDFIRVRVGVGRPRSDAVAHVLDGFSSGERKELPFVIEAGADAVERILEAGVERAMNEVNTRTGR